MNLDQIVKGISLPAEWEKEIVASTLINIKLSKNNQIVSK